MLSICAHVVCFVGLSGSICIGCCKIPLLNAQQWLDQVWMQLRVAANDLLSWIMPSFVARNWLCISNYGARLALLTLGSEKTSHPWQKIVRSHCLLYPHLMWSIIYDAGVVFLRHRVVHFIFNSLCWFSCVSLTTIHLFVLYVVSRFLTRKQKAYNN